MKTIWKYELEIVNVQRVGMPVGAEILSVADQLGKLCLWASVDPAGKTKARLIHIFGTGHPINLGVDELEFVGTVLTAGGTLVWHVFEQTNS